VHGDQSTAFLSRIMYKHKCNIFLVQSMQPCLQKPNKLFFFLAIIKEGREAIQVVDKSTGYYYRNFNYLSYYIVTRNPK
jgi:hypothetical protein